MFKKTIIGLFALSTIILAGCGSKATTTTTGTGSTQEIGVASCDKYLKLVQCVADKSGAGGAAYKTQLDQAIASWKQLPKEELDNTCNQMLKTLEANKDAFEKIGCSLN